jgi:hypothetical protein
VSHGNKLACSLGSVESVLGVQKSMLCVNSEPSWVSRNRNDRLSGISCKAIPESLTETGGCHAGGVPDIGLFPKGGGYPCDFGCALPSHAKS